MAFLTLNLFHIELYVVQSSMKQYRKKNTSKAFEYIGPLTRQNIVFTLTKVSKFDTYALSRPVRLDRPPTEDFEDFSVTSCSDVVGTGVWGFLYFFEEDKYKPD